MDQFGIAYNRALRFLSFRQRSEKEVRDYFLSSKGRSALGLNSRAEAFGGKKSTKNKMVDPQIIDRVVAKLKEKRFLNDEEFALMWRDRRLRSKPKSQRLIKIELKHKGISQEIIDTIFTNDQATATDAASAKKILEKKIEKVKHLPRQEIYQKLGGFLARRGFDWETTKLAIDEVLQEEYNNIE